jgi:hypothetical protein
MGICTNALETFTQSFCSRDGFLHKMLINPILPVLHCLEFPPLFFFDLFYTATTKESLRLGFFSKQEEKRTNFFYLQEKSSYNIQQTTNNKEEDKMKQTNLTMKLN